MPRSKTGQKRKKQDSADMLQAAELVLKSGWSVRQAALELKVAKSTLAMHIKQHKLSGRSNEEFSYNPKNDVKRIFRNEEEEMLKNYLKQASMMHYGLTRKQFRCLVFDFAQTNNKMYPERWDRDGMAGKSWYYEFMRRHKDALSLRKPEPTSLARSSSFNRHNVETFFMKLKEIQGRENFTPDRIYNLDETGVSTVHNPGNVIATKGVKQVGHMTSGERGVNITLISAVNATGNSIPPAFVFPRVHFKDAMLKGAPPGSIGMAHVSGWSNAEIFLKYLKHFVEVTQPNINRKILIILDNHQSHISVNCLQLAKDSGIVLLTFPPHTSHKLQPLDRSVFGPLKKFYNTACSEWMLTHCGKPMTIYDVAECVGKAYPHAFTQQNIIAGFKVSGIWPINENIFGDHEFLSSYVTDRPQTPTTDGQQPVEVIHNQPSTSNPYEIVSPEQIRPFPKAVSRKVRPSGRKPGRCRILTDTPEKTEIQNEEQRRQAKKAHQGNKRRYLFPSQNKTCQKSRPKPDSTTEDEDEDAELSQSSDSLEDVEFGLEEEEECTGDISITDISDVKVGDFVVARVMGKKREHFYVVEVCEKQDLILEVKYLKRANRLSGNKFIYCSDTIYDLPESDVVWKLPAPIHVRATARQARFLVFSVNFDSYDVE